MTYALWALQILLALLFLFAGGVKFIMPAEEMTAQSPIPLAVIYAVGALEILGALGLVLPGLLRTRTSLIPLAAAGLTLVMLGAVVTTVATMDASFALMPLVIGILTALVAIGRRRREPLNNRVPVTQA